MINTKLDLDHYFFFIIHKNTENEKLNFKIPCSYDKPRDLET